MVLAIRRSVDDRAIHPVVPVAEIAKQVVGQQLEPVVTDRVDLGQVKVGIDEPGDHCQSLSVDGPASVSLYLAYGLDHVSLYSNGTFVWFLSGSLIDRCVLDENIVFSHKNL